MVAAATIVSGCRAHQLQYDQDQFRSKLMQMYTDQVMDNLIRCYNGLPFVQLDYSKVTGTVTQNNQANIGGTQGAETDISSNNALGAAAAITLNLTRKLTSGQAYAWQGSQQNQLTVTADPVINDPTVYRAYLKFLDSTQDRRLMVTPDCPPPDTTLITRKVGKLYYWVPVAYRDDFRELSLRTTAMRGEVVEAPENWETVVTGVLKTVLNDEKKDPKTGNPISKQYDLYLAIDPKIPKDDGVMQRVSVDGRLYDFGVAPGDVKSAKRGEKIDQITISYTQEFRPADQIDPKAIKGGHIPVSPDDLAKALAGQKVKVFLNNYRPPIQHTPDLLKSIDNEIRIFRLNTTTNFGR
jgi:hypothetical protein